MHFISHFSSHCLSICVKSSWIFIYNLARVCSEGSADSRCFVRTRTSCSQAFRWDNRLLRVEFRHTCGAREVLGLSLFTGFCYCFYSGRLLLPCMLGALCHQFLEAGSVPWEVSWHGCPSRALLQASALGRGWRWEAQMVLQHDVEQPHGLTCLGKMCRVRQQV